MEYPDTYKYQCVTRVHVDVSLSAGKNMDVARSAGKKYGRRAQRRKKMDVARSAEESKYIVFNRYTLENLKKKKF